MASTWRRHRCTTRCARTKSASGGALQLPHASKQRKRCPSNRLPQRERLAALPMDDLVEASQHACDHRWLADTTARMQDCAGARHGCGPAQRRRHGQLGGGAQRAGIWPGRGPGEHRAAFRINPIGWPEMAFATRRQGTALQAQGGGRGPGEHAEMAAYHTLQQALCRCCAAAACRLNKFTCRESSTALQFVACPTANDHPAEWQMRYTHD